MLVVCSTGQNVCSLLSCFVPVAAQPHSPLSLTPHAHQVDSSHLSAYVHCLACSSVPCFCCPSPFAMCLSGLQAAGLSPGAVGPQHLWSWRLPLQTKVMPAPRHTGPGARGWPRAHILHGLYVLLQPGLLEGRDLGHACQFAQPWVCVGSRPGEPLGSANLASSSLPGVPRLAQGKVVVDPSPCVWLELVVACSGQSARSPSKGIGAHDFGMLFP